MRIIEPHIHMFSRTTDDYEMMAAAGIEAVVEPAFWLGSDRSSVSSFADYFEHLITVESARAASYGIEHFSCIGLNPKEANNLPLAMDVVECVGEYLGSERVVALGEIGFNEITDAEEEAFRRQLRLGNERGTPIVIHTPHHNKKAGVQRIVEIIRDEEVEQSRILIDHNTEETVPTVLALDTWVGLTIYPIIKLSPERATNIVKQYGTDRIIISSAADWGHSDPLSVPKTILKMRQSGFSRSEIRKVVFENPYNFYKQSPRFTFE